MTIIPTTNLIRRLILISEEFRLISLVIAIATLLLIAYLDYRVGYEISLVLLYVFPVMFGTWAVGRRAGFGLASAGALLWLLIDSASGYVYHEPVSPYWNATMRFGLLILIVQFVIVIKSILADERDRSRTDPLTGIANRRALFESLSRQKSRSDRGQELFSLAYIDIDRFKTLNDKYGHSEGDRALQLICQTIDDSLRGIDLLARMGGDEFAVLLPDCNAATAQLAMARCLDQCAELEDWPRWGITLSVGVCTFGQSSLTADQMLSRVDQIMYRGKHAGENAIVLEDTTSSLAA